MSKTDRTVVRNGAYKKTEFSIRERHNERLNENYYNADIEQDRKHLNVYFKQNEGSYAETFEKMLADGTITVKGLKTDGSAKVFDELVFDVNTDYFERSGAGSPGGGYEYAKSFFEEAYRLAVEEIGGEEYVLSAVMHADERNKALSEQYGRDVYHYHLHVVYIPVVDKEVLWSKRCKDPELVGTVKEVIKQVSHSKKWPKLKQYHENGEVVRNAKGKAELVNSYSLLQDRYHDHMKNAGYIGFERGERGSTAEHLEVLEFKAKMEAERAKAEAKRAAEYTAVAEEKQKEAAAHDADISVKSKKSANLDKSVERKQEKFNELTAKTAVAEKEAVEYEEIEKLGHKRGILGGVTVAADWWTKILSLVKEAISSRSTIKQLKAENKALKADVKSASNALEQQKAAYLRLVDRVQPYLDAVKLFPQQIKETIAQYLDLGRKQREQQRLEQAERERERKPPIMEQTAPKRKRSNDLDR